LPASVPTVKIMNGKLERFEELNELELKKCGPTSNLELLPWFQWQAVITQRYVKQNLKSAKLRANGYTRIMQAIRV